MRPTPKNLIPALIWLAAACGGEAPSSTPTRGAEAELKTTGKVINVQLVTDEKGSYYNPSIIEANRGDVIRFTLKSGVHNVSFPDSSNSIKDGLPKSSDFLQLPGQEYDFVVNLRPGTYHFHCDPHAALGMHATLTVK